jgi:hypothetical protein
MSNRIFRVCLLVFIIVIAGEIFAQCPMCKMAAESNLKNGGTAGKGLNNGILYLLAMPYLLVSVLGYIWWKKRKQLSVNE